MNSPFRTRLFAAAALSVLWLTSTPVHGEDAVIEKDIPYGKGGDKDLKLDLARPEHANGLRPALVFIHGGGWRGGNRSVYRKDIEEAARRGYVAVTISYRLTDPDSSGKATHPFPAQVEDVKCAVRWLRANADKYQIDPKRIGATGGSAGGHLSLMLGVTDASAGLEGTGGNPQVSSRVQAVVNYFGPTDLAHLHATSKNAAPIVEVLLNGGPQNLEESYRKASPITYVSKDDPPILTIHGAADALVPPDQATLFDAAMRKAGAPHELLILDGEKHGFSKAGGSKARQAMFKFFDEHLKNG